MAQVPGALPSRHSLQANPSQSSSLITYTVTRGDSILERHTVDLNEEVRVIVQFQSPPLSTVHAARDKRAPLGNSLSTLQGQIASDHTRFRSDLARLEGEALSRKTHLFQATSSRISAEFREVFNGVVLSSRHWLADRLRALPYVKAIFPDRPVHTLDSVSNHQIGADAVWAQFGATGDSVRIGVLDTGIDYLHPDLGGGFGPGHKVAGGWDFVNNDPDPADDNGHGTHVAGIISANGPSLKGVAPAATLYAYKVLDTRGAGDESTIIAALERCVDPDGDPATDDHLDIANLSLGGSGDPSDPLGQAVDNATAAGVLCVVAAGNDGPRSQTVNSPGCAAGALTVGACDSFDSLAFFSSRGPTNVLFTIKPDLVAPGMSITSTMPGGTYQALSGTSMATPHATGAAALLKQLHRDWPPEMLKSALMSGTKDLGRDIWSQGKGQLDVLKAAHARILASPQTLSFGLDDLTLPRWSLTDTVMVYNLTDSSTTLSVGPPAGLPWGFMLTTDPTSLTVPAHDSRPLRVTLSVENTVAQIPKSDLQDVIGVMTLIAPQDTLTLPWAVVLGTYVDLEILSANARPWVGFTRLSDGKWTSTLENEFIFTGSSARLRKLLAPGTYEIIALLAVPDTLDHWREEKLWIIRDSVTVNPAASVTMSGSEALYRVGTLLKDEQGAVIDSTLRLSWAMRVSSKRTGVGFTHGVVGGTLRDDKTLDRACPLSSNYVFDYYYATAPDQPKVYSYAGRVSPLAADQVRDVQPADLMRRDVQYRLRAGEPTIKAVETLVFGPWSGVSIYSGNSEQAGLAAPFHQAWYAQGHPVDNFPWNGILFNHLVWFDGSGPIPFDPHTSALRLITPNQIPGADGVLRSSVLTSTGPFQESRGKRVTYGLGPHHYFGRMDNGPMSLKVKTNTSYGLILPPSFTSEICLPLFLNQAMDAALGGLSLFLEDSTGRVINSGTSLERTFLDMAEGHYDGSLLMPLPQAGRYTLQLWDGASYVGSLRGAANVHLTMDTRLQDRIPPAITSFNIFGADSEYTDMLLPGEQGNVEFRLSDAEGPLRSVSLFFHTDSNRTWQTLVLSSEGNLYRAQLPLFSLPDRLVSLRVLATDGSGNALDYRAEPALQVGKDSVNANRAPVLAHPLSPDSGGTLQLYSPGKKVSFSWHPSFDYDGWDTLSYTFHIRGSGLGATYDRWCRDTAITLDLMGTLAKDEVYQWWVETTDGHVLVQSDTATFRTSSTILGTPGAESELPEEFHLAQNYPNPFNPSTIIRYDLPREAHVALKVYNVLGQEVVTLVETVQRPGRYAVEFNGGKLASGLYIYRLEAHSLHGAKAEKERIFTAVRKFLLLR